MTDIKTLRRILDASQTVAVVGMSNKVHRPSYFVGKYLLDHGYTVYPVNPMFDEVLGLKSYASLEDIPGSVDIVDCFRRANQMVDITRSAIDLNAK
ncbi:MAG: putative CoA-binding protein, partial [Porticoccaceae bacterium]